MLFGPRPRGYAQRAQKCRAICLAPYLRSGGSSALQPQCAMRVHVEALRGIHHGVREGVQCIYSCLDESALVPFLLQKLKSASLQEMEEHYQLFNMIFKVVSALARNPPLWALLLRSRDPAGLLEGFGRPTP